MERFWFFLILGVLSLPLMGEQKAELQSRAFRFHEKPSLKVYGEALKSGVEISDLVKKTQRFLEMKEGEFPEAQIQKVLTSNQKNMEELKKLFVSSQAFSRGEIDDEKVLNQLLGYFQCSVLQIRSAFLKNQDLRAKEEIHAWFTFVADLPYEEASLISMRFANVVRSLLLDELESMQKKYPLRWGQDELWLHWSEKLRASWPIDRVVLTESKKVLNNRMMKYALEIASQLQKNAYQSMDSVLTGHRAGKAKDLQFLKGLWRDEDILAMKTEVSRISAFRLRLARAVYEKRTGQKLGALEALVAAKLISQVPINYLTGKPFDLAAVAL